MILYRFIGLTYFLKKTLITNHFRKILINHVVIKSFNVIYKIPGNVIVIPWKI